MEDKELIERLVQVEQRSKSNTKRIDEHDEKLEDIHDLTYAVKELVKIYNMCYNLSRFNVSKYYVGSESNGSIEFYNNNIIYNKLCKYGDKYCIIY